MKKPQRNERKTRGRVRWSAWLGGNDIALADKIARDIMSEGDGPTPCQRIQFMGGKYPDAELGQGGLCESSLARCIAKSLKRHTRPLPPNDGTERTATAAAEQRQQTNRERR